MNNIHEIQGDIFLTDAQCILHSCNNLGYMGAGIAKDIKSKFPLVYDSYKTLCKNKNVTPGDVYIERYYNPWIINLIGQDRLGQADIKYLYRGLTTIQQIYKRENIQSISLPKIGAGLGNLQWNSVFPIIKNTLGKLDIPIFIYTEYIKNVKGDERGATGNIN